MLWQKLTGALSGCGWLLVAHEMADDLPPLVNMNPVPREALVAGKRYYIFYNDGVGLPRIGEFLHIEDEIVAYFREIAVEIDVNGVLTSGRPRYHDPNEERFGHVNLDWASFYEYVHVGH